MIFFKFLLFILVGVSITNIVVNSILFEPIRLKLSYYTGDLFNCMMCTGFWSGVIISLLDTQDFGIIYGGLIISLTAYTYGVFIDLINLYTSKLENIYYAEEE